MKQLGFSGIAIGSIFSVTTICLQFLLPIIGGVMDRYPHHKISILQMISIGHLTCFYLMQFVPPIQATAKTLEPACLDSGLSFRVARSNPCFSVRLDKVYGGKVACDLSCQHNPTPMHVFLESASIEYKEKALSITFGNVTCNHHIQEDSLCKLTCDDDEITRILNRTEETNIIHPSYLKMLVLCIGAFVCLRGVESNQDAICHLVVNRYGEDFGKQRVFGSIAFGLGAIVTGVLVDKASANSFMFQYKIAFDLMFFFWLSDIIVLNFVVCPPPTQVPATKEILAGEMQRSIRTPQGVGFLLTCLLVGISRGVLKFHFILLEDLGKALTTCDEYKDLTALQGLVLALNGIGEIPIFIFAGFILSKIGEKKAMQIVLFLYALRFGYYSQMTSPWQTVYIEFISGGCQGLFMPAQVSFAHAIAPEGCGTTIMALANSVLNGAGVAIGSTMAGICYEAIGSSGTFNLFSMVLSFAFLFSILT